MPIDRIGGPSTADWGAGDAASAAAPAAAATPAAPAAPSTGGSRADVMARLTSAAAAAPAAPSAKATAAVNEIKRLMAGHTDRGEEKRIIDIFKSATAADLNHIVSTLDMHELLEDVDDRLIGPDNKTEMYKVISQQRLGELSIDSRAKIITSLQRNSTDSGEEKFIKDIFVGTKGKDLTALKNAIDDGGDVYDLHKLMFDDIDDAGIRKAIIAHFQSEGARAPTGQNKVLSDIDDTFYANLKDPRYPKGTVYPGVRKFYEELDRGAGASADRAGDLTFLTARPEDEAHVIETNTIGMLKGKGVKNMTVLGGDFAHVVGNENIAAGKFAKFEEYKSLYPEYGFVFTGDSGQGDAIFGAKMLEKFPGSAKVAFIHDVVNTPAAKRAEQARKGVVYFDTYAGAGVEAFDRGLITKDGLARVARSAVDEFKTTTFASPQQKAARQAELKRDVERANAKLPAGMKVPLP